MKSSIEKAVEQLKNITTLGSADPTKDSDPNKIMAHAYDQLDDVIILGYDKDGEFYFASSVADGGSVLWLLENCKSRLMGISTENAGGE